MKILNLVPALVLSGLMTGTALAAPNVIVGSDSISVGGAATIDLTFQADGVVAGLDFTFSFDDTQFTPTPACVATLPTTGSDATVVCSVVGSTIKVLVSAPLAFPVPTIATGDQSLGSISFQSAGTTPVAGYDLLITEENYFDINAAAVTPTASTNGLITVNAGPQPAFTGTPAGLVMTGEQGAANPTGSLTVTNTGEASTTLTGTCTASGDAQISANNGAFSVDQGAAGHVVGVACDATAAGSYSATLSCDHNGSNATPVDFAVTCDIAPPGAAVYSSVPAPGSTIEMTPDGDVPAGTAVPDQVLTISNGATDALDNDLALMNCAWAGSAEITATAPSTPLAPSASTNVTFSCDSAAVGAYTGTYSCDYDVDDDAVSDGTARYTVNCGVREAAADIEESPLSGETIRIVVAPFGTGQTSVSFAEILDEGIDASVDSCTLADGTNFSVITALPMTVTAGSTGQVVVQGTDPGTGEVLFSDTLTCTYTDSDSTPGTASWPVDLVIQAAPIPTLSAWGLMAMILTMMGLGGIVIRRRVLS